MDHDKGTDSLSHISDSRGECVPGQSANKAVPLTSQPVLLQTFDEIEFKASEIRE